VLKDRCLRNNVNPSIILAVKVNPLKPAFQNIQINFVETLPSIKTLENWASDGRGISIEI
jgi:hypothetical protein